MQRKRTAFMMIFGGVLLVIATSVWLASAKPASAQCGSSASSCKNCHEVQGQLPVNNDGTGWHQSHAFGDFCYICHAGNNQAMDAVEAHTGMVYPLEDVQASCIQCHPADLQARAEVYATALGVEIGSGSGSSQPPDSGAASSGTTTAAEPVANVPVTTALNVDDPNLVDYVQRYEEIVLGKKPVNWGNVILYAMIAMLLVGGGGFVILNEKLVKVTFGDTKKVEGEYPADVIDLLPSLTSLKPQARKSLKNILGNPGRTEKVLGLIDEVVADNKKEN